MKNNMEEPINLINGDCLEVMKDIPDKSIDAIICAVFIHEFSLEI